MKKVSLNRQKRKRTVCDMLALSLPTKQLSYLICVIEIQNPAPRSIYLLMTSIGSSHN